MIAFGPPSLLAAIRGSNTGENWSIFTSECAADARAFSSLTTR